MFDISVIVFFFKLPLTLNNFFIFLLRRILEIEKKSSIFGNSAKIIKLLKSITITFFLISRMNGVFNTPSLLYKKFSIISNIVKFHEIEYFN